VHEMENCVNIIITTIKFKDPDQFNALLESIGEATVAPIVSVVSVK